MKKTIDSIREYAMLIHTYIHTYIHTRLTPERRFNLELPFTRKEVTDI